MRRFLLTVLGGGLVGALVAVSGMTGQLAETSLHLGIALQSEFDRTRCQSVPLTSRTEWPATTEGDGTPRSDRAANASSVVATTRG